MTANSGARRSQGIQLLTVEEAAEKLREDPKTVYRKLRRGAYPWVDIAEPGQRVKIRFREDQLDALIEARTRNAESIGKVAA